VVQFSNEHFGLYQLVLMPGQIDERDKMLNNFSTLVVNRIEK